MHNEPVTTAFPPSGAGFAAIAGHTAGPSLSLALFMWGTAVSFYLFGFFHRVTPAVLTPELMRNFGLSAAMRGKLSASYFYAGMQIPAETPVDRYGPRKMRCVGCLAGGLGAMLFAFAGSYPTSAMGRGLLGG